MSLEQIQKTKSLMKLLEITIRDNWDQLAFSDYGSDLSFTYAEVARECKRLHEYFRDMGLEPGDRVALCDKNSSRWAVAYLAALTFGAVTVPILSDFKGEQIANILEHSESKLLIVGESLLHKVQAEAALPEGLQLLDIATVGTVEYTMPFAQADVRYFEDKPDDLAMLSYTSGSTGHSKGVMLPYRSMWSNILFADEKLGMERRSRVISLLPMAHMYGLAFEFIYEFCIGCHITYLAKTPSPTVLMQAFSEIRPRIIIAVPLIIEKIVQGKVFPVIRAVQMRTILQLPLINDFVYWRIKRKLTKVFGGQFYEVIVGGAAFNSEVETFLKRIHFPYTVGYGMTECGPIICYRDWKKFVKGSCGRQVPRMEVKILSDDPQNVPGEIVCRGTNVMLGYYKNDEATAEAIDEEGWLHTGDLGTMDKDGNVFIRGRSKNMLLGANGQNIYPEEIEEKLTGHALIDECVVVQRDEKLIGLVYTSDDTLRRHGMTREDFDQQLDRYRRHVNQMLPGFYHLAHLESRTEAFEKTPKHNIKRFLYT